MNIYKVIFAKNEVISCDLLNKQISINGEYSYEHDKWQLIYALIKAKTEVEAINKANEIIREFTEKTFGKDFIK